MNGPTGLSGRIRAAVAHPATDDAFDPAAALDGLLAGTGLSAADAGGRIGFVGADPVVPSALRLGGGAAVALAAKSVGVAAIHRDRGGDGQDVTVDVRRAPHRLCPFYDRRWELLNGYPAASPAITSQALGFTFHETRDGRWVMPLNPYPKLRHAAETFLGAPEAGVADAIRRWDAADLEEAAAAAGIVLPMARTPQEWLDTAQHAAIADTPPITLRRIGDAPPEPFPGRDRPEQPLDGLRALGMGHVIAGAGTGRSLALHGADVLNVWRPDEFEHDTTYISANVGVRSCTVDPRTSGGRSLLRGLLAGADVFHANRRPGYLESIGLSAEEAAAVRPGIVHATTTLHGPHGPWADRIGFDQSAGTLVGMMTLEGGGGRPRLSPILVVNDYIVSWLAAAGICAALRRRATEGGSWAVEVSLVRAALWMLELGVFDLGYAREIAGTGTEHAYPDPETFTASTPLGHYQGVTDQVRMTATPGGYRTVLVPRGSSRPGWLPHGAQAESHGPVV
ncbi:MULTISPECIES: CoA transferase [Pseudonocardia]|uniref:E-cinnamoyl-CoA:R-phenyllactate CoA transferase n=2 Tax=Pseudonocardia TaxID=1847 RepID=A0A1Y2N6J0_PSEAH|nr:MULTISPECIES: CoA transferase [Pseudonocardia]OSY43092.1 E-cinnamoyl-CoA:R-phenyllactate CoA transferase [Pseudonocardia autotrophica]TDN71580.1 CoA transferase family III [Pseudonocardia autotrophica]BBG02268.1 carnitine dehydratase [Pseudonocardia autotrophica]GEC23396.1 carnitine dehydratase [Pseudonocardia saturnea]